MPGAAEIGAAGKVGRVHQDLRRSTRRHTLYREMADLYGDYSTFKTRVQEETGLQWALDASLLQQWGMPGGGSPALQFLAGLSVNYDLFVDPTLGAG